MKAFTLIIASILAATAVHAACPDVQATNTQDFLNEIPSLNTQLQGCPVDVGRLSWFMGNPTQVAVQMNDGSTENFWFSVQNKQVTSVNKGITVCKKRVTTNERVMDSILSSSHKGQATLFQFANGGFSIKGCTFWSKFGSFWSNLFAKPIAKLAAPKQMPPVAAGPTGKPEYCDETYLPGHRDYAQNKALWDSYSADTDKVCQSQYGRGTPSPCIHIVQLSVSGNPYYLCWYNE